MLHSVPDQPDPLYRDHPRSYGESLYVYPVLSRRAGGVSIGVNLSRDKVCTFDCVYCQVDRSTPTSAANLQSLNPKPQSAIPNPRYVPRHIDLPLLAVELHAVLDEVLSGRMFDTPRFRHVPQGLRRLNDIALSGDGEPTACPQFVEVVELLARARRERRLDDVKLVLLTNSSLLHLERVERGLEVLDANGGEIWAKLDAGTEDYYRQISRSRVPWQRILDNLCLTAARRAIVIQSLFVRLHGRGPSDEEIAAYGARLCEIAAAGRIKLVQILTIARPPAEPFATPLPAGELERLAAAVRRRTGLPVEVFC